MSPIRVAFLDVVKVLLSMVPTFLASAVQRVVACRA
jgi:hypothetical protein